MKVNSPIQLLILYLFIKVATGNDDDETLPKDDDDDDHSSDETRYATSYRVKFGPKTKAIINPKFENLYEKYIPAGCYGEKQLRSMLRVNRSKIAHVPIKPKDLCKENGSLVPEEFSKFPPQSSTPPFEIRSYKFHQSDVYRVVVKSLDENVRFTDVVLEAREIDDQQRVASSHRGRFLLSKGVRLYCCHFVDKDIARYNSESSDGDADAVFYWVPVENTKIEDFDGTFRYRATVAKSPTEYWINVRSKTITVTSKKDDGEILSENS